MQKQLQNNTIYQYLHIIYINLKPKININTETGVKTIHYQKGMIIFHFLKALPDQLTRGTSQKYIIYIFIIYRQTISYQISIPSRRPEGEGANLDRRLVPYYGKCKRIQLHMEFIYIFICINGRPHARYEEIWSW